MGEVEIKKTKNNVVTVINTHKQSNYISHNDAEMDARAVQAVRAAVEKAKFCDKPVAKYDMDAKKAYIEYANGEIEYVN